MRGTQNVYVRKVKILKAPKFDMGKLLELFVSSFCVLLALQDRI